MSRLVNDRSLQILFDWAPQTVPVDQLPRLEAYLKTQPRDARERFYGVLVTLLPRTPAEGETLSGVLLRAPSEVRVSARGIAALTHAFEVAGGTTGTATVH